VEHCHGLKLQSAEHGAIPINRRRRDQPALSATANFNSLLDGQGVSSYPDGLCFAVCGLADHGETMAPRGWTRMRNNESARREPLLKKGGRVRVVAPSRWVTKEMAAEATAIGKSAGLDVAFSDQCFLRNNQFAGTDRERAAEFAAALADTSYDAVWIARGGYGAARITEYIDWSRLAEQCRNNKTKVLVGYSDATPLLEIASRLELAVAIHGPMPIDIHTDQKRGSVRQLLDGLVSVPRGAINRRAILKCKALRSGQARGRLRGGNLTLITKMICGEHRMRFSGSVLFFEDADEHDYAIDRNLLCLRQAGILADLSGVVIGQFTKIFDSPVPFGSPVRDMVLHHCRDYTYPVLYGLQSGHGDPNEPLLLDEEIAFVASQGAILWAERPNI
jgi:muramoyltetrapeptide carboxypeptidase